MDAAGTVAARWEGERVEEAGTVAGEVMQAGVVAVEVVVEVVVEMVY